MTRSPCILSKKLGLEFNQPQLFKMALTHRSAATSNNERLEFLGDSVLGFVIAEKLYEKFPEASEGVLSRLRAGLVNQASLAELARELEIGHYLLLGSGELKSGGYRRDSILSDAFEAIMGAIILDQGVDACRQWILRIFDNKICRLSLENWQKDPKTMLQEAMQARKLDLPEYSLVNMNGMPHEQMFKVQCCISMLKEPCTGTGPSRKKAEQAAAEKVLAKLDELSGE